MVLSRRRRLGFWLLRRLEGLALWIVRMSDKRDAEIERIAAALRGAMPVLSGDGDTVVIEQGYSSDGIAAALYDAGLRVRSR